MFRAIIAFLAVAACVVSASVRGSCYPGYGVYCNTGGVVGGVTKVLNRGCATPVISSGIVSAPVVPSGVVSAPVLSSRIISTPVITTNPCTAPFVPDVCNSCKTYVTPLYKDTVGCPEVYSSCENSAVGVCSGF